MLQRIIGVEPITQVMHVRNKNTNIRGRSHNAIKMISHTTRGIWKVLSMVLYLSNRFTNPIMFDIILKI